MKPFVNGWNIFKCILTPSELREALAGFSHVNFQSRVSEDYVQSNPNEFFDKYESFYQKLMGGYCFEWKQDWEYFQWHTGITNNLDKCAYGTPFKDEKNGKLYKLSNFAEPCVGIGPFALTISGDKKLHTNYSYTQFPQFTVGLQIEYPHLLVRGENGETKDAPTDTFAVYNIICQRIKEMCSGLTFTAYEKKYRANVKIGALAQQHFLNFNFSKFHHCT